MQEHKVKERVGSTGPPQQPAWLVTPSAGHTATLRPSDFAFCGLRLLFGTRMASVNHNSRYEFWPGNQPGGTLEKEPHGCQKPELGPSAGPPTVKALHMDRPKVCLLRRVWQGAGDQGLVWGANPIIPLPGPRTLALSAV